LFDSQDADIGGGDFEQSSSQAALSAWRTEALAPIKAGISLRYKRLAARRNPSKGLTNTVGIGGQAALLSVQMFPIGSAQSGPCPFWSWQRRKHAMMRRLSFALLRKFLVRDTLV
jgi:hypothetical protein